MGDGKMAAGSSGGPGAPCRHHAQLGACESRAKYREGWRPRAVKVPGRGAVSGGVSPPPGERAGGGPGRAGSPAAPGEGERKAPGLACCAAGASRYCSRTARFGYLCVRSVYEEL